VIRASFRASRLEARKIGTRTGIGRVLAPKGRTTHILALFNPNGTTLSCIGVNRVDPRAKYQSKDGRFPDTELEDSMLLIYSSTKYWTTLLHSSYLFVATPHYQYNKQSWVLEVRYIILDSFLEGAETLGQMSRMGFAVAVPGQEK
jgi:hypothetical protein